MFVDKMPFRELEPRTIIKLHDCPPLGQIHHISPGLSQARKKMPSKQQKKKNDISKGAVSLVGVTTLVKEVLDVHVEDSEIFGCLGEYHRVPEVVYETIRLYELHGMPDERGFLYKSRYFERCEYLV